MITDARNRMMSHLKARHAKAMVPTGTKTAPATLRRFPQEMDFQSGAVGAPLGPAYWAKSNRKSSLPGMIGKYLHQEKEHLLGRGPQRMEFPGMGPLGKIDQATRAAELGKYVNEAKTPFQRANRYVQEAFPKEYKGFQRTSLLEKGKKANTRRGFTRPLEYQHPTGAKVGFESISPRRGEAYVDSISGPGFTGSMNYGRSLNTTKPEQLRAMFELMLAPGMRIDASIVNQPLQRLAQKFAAKHPGYLPEYAPGGALHQAELTSRAAFKAKQADNQRLARFGTDLRQRLYGDSGSGHGWGVNAAGAGLLGGAFGLGTYLTLLTNAANDRATKHKRPRR